MITSQWLMVVALGFIGLVWIVTRVVGYRTPAVQHIFGALCVQATAAILLSFSSDSLLLSLALVAIILGAVIWMIQRDARSISQPQG